MSFPYVEYAPPRIWAHDIETIWSLKSPPPVPRNLTEVLPADGRVELMFGFAGRSMRQAGLQPPQRYSGAFVMGSRSQGYALQHEGASHFIAVRFRPGGLAAFLPMPLVQLTDRVVDLRDLWGREIQDLHERLYDASLPDARRLIQAFLQGHYAPPNHYTTIQYALRQIHQRQGQIRVGSLADDLNMSQKHLERLFQRYVGHTPKSYARIVRFQSALQVLTIPGAGDVAGLANQLGYFDQAHLINDFKDFTGLTPGQYQAKKSRVVEMSLSGIV